MTGMLPCHNIAKTMDRTYSGFMRGSAAMWRRPPIHSGRHRPGASCLISCTKRATSRLAAAIRPPLIQKRWCGCATITASMLPTPGPMVWPTIAPDWVNDSAPPMRPGGVFATRSAMPAGTTPLKKPIMAKKNANQSGVVANGTMSMKAPMPTEARSTMSLRP